MKWNKIRRLSFVIVILMLLGVAVQPSHAAGWYVIETLTDRCSVGVVIKVPYSYDPYYKLDDGDVILDRSGVSKYMIQPLGPYSGVTVNPDTGYSPWTTKIIPVPKNADGYFRWYCGITAERSRCPSNTGAISSRLGPDRLFQTRCLKYG
jgi:hypothetical protein